jgi:hypothetical protein
MSRRRTAPRDMQHAAAQVSNLLHPRLRLTRIRPAAPVRHPRRIQIDAAVLKPAEVRIVLTVPLYIQEPAQNLEMS